ncbi:DUF6551 family protein [Sphingobium sp. R-7]|uniref:DUF6551 family protein n=1 Tax=Sphingobium sp. R-7 TaxID=3375449 RepID=UPI00398A9CD3
MRGASYPTTPPPSHIWIYERDRAMPEWVAAKKADAVQPNGTFLIHSEMGQARVHPGNVIFDYKGNLYACPPGEVQRMLQEMEDRFAPDPKVIARIVPQSAAKLPSGSTPSPKKTAASARPVAKAQSSPRKWPAAKGNPPSVENRHPSELNLDDSYQRSTENGASQALIKKIATGWDWRMCLPLVVSKRDDGSLWVIDGQHRLAAAMLRGDIPFLPCCVGVYGSVADEAAMFVAMNRARKPMNRLDDFHAAIASGDSEAIEIADIIKGAGFTVSRKTGSQSWVPGEVAFTSAIAKVLRKHGAKVCSDALTIMQEAWPDEVLNAGASMFTALTKLAINPPADFDPDRMFHALLKRDQREWASFLNETKGGGEERALALRQVLLMAYDEEPEVRNA